MFVWKTIRTSTRIYTPEECGEGPHLASSIEDLLSVSISMFISELIPVSRELMFGAYCLSSEVDVEGIYGIGMA